MCGPIQSEEAAYAMARRWYVAQVAAHPERTEADFLREIGDDASVRARAVRNIFRQQREREAAARQMAFV